MNATIQIRISSSENLYKIIERVSRFVKRFLKDAEVDTIIHHTR